MLQSDKNPARGRRRWLAALMVAAAAGTVAPSEAALKPQSHHSIRQVVYQFLAAQLSNGHDTGHKPEIEVGKLDPRLRLPQCATALRTFATGTRRLVGNTTVGVHCSGPKPWTLYVAAHTTVFGRIVVTTRPLPRGHVLNRSDLRVEERDLTTIRGTYLRQPAQAAGQMLRRQLQAGSVLRLNEIAPPILVHRGEQVSIDAGTGPVQVRVYGKALNNGAQGDLVQVRNLSSRRIVQGVVTGSGAVTVQ